MGSTDMAPAFVKDSVVTGVLLLLVVACDGGGMGEPGAVTIDTLPGGALHVQNAGTGVWSGTPDARWRVVEDLRIGRMEGTGPDVFGRVRSVVVDDLDRMWVVDGLANEVRVFDADGSFVRTVGRRGSGPGEFQRIGSAFPGPDGEIWVEDLSLARWERFDTAGVRVGGLRSTSRLRGAMRVWTRDGRFIVLDIDPADPDRGVFVEHRLAGPDSLVTEGTYDFPETPDPDLLDSGARAGMPVPFAPLSWLQVSPEGEVWVSYGSRDYVIFRQTLAGDTVQVIERTHDPVSIPDSVRRRAHSELGLDADPGDAGRTEHIPRIYPPFDEFHVSDDGSLWVLRSLPDGSAGFDVFESDGRYLGQPEVPSDLGSMRIQQITATHVYAIVPDSLGVDHVVRLAVERPGRTLTHWDSVPEIELETELRIDGAAAGLGLVGRIAVSEDGSMAVSQPETSSLVVFSERGVLLDRFGRAGSQTSQVAIVAEFGWLADSLWMYDRTREQLVYGRTLPARVTGTAPLPRQGVPSVDDLPLQFSRILPLALYPDGSIYASAVVPRDPPELSVSAAVRSYVRINPAGQVSRVVAEILHAPLVIRRTLTGFQSVRIPFARGGLHAVSADGGYVATAQAHLEGPHGGSFQVVLQGALGDTIYSRDYPFVGVPIPTSLTDSLLEARAQRLESAELARFLREETPIPPVYAPVLSLAVGRDGRVWVGLRDETDERVHLILDPCGVPVGIASLPEPARVVAVDGSNVWVVEPDTTGVDGLIRYRTGEGMGSTTFTRESSGRSC